MKFTRNKGSKRLRARKGNGRFVKPTLNALVCSECRGMVMPDGDSPETCKHCGKPFKDISEVEG